MTIKTSKSRRITTLAALALAAGAVSFGTLAKAESWHTINDACFVSPFSNTTAFCSFAFPAPTQVNASVRLFGVGGPAGLVQGCLSTGWNIADLPNKSPEMNFRRVCSTALGNWNNSTTYPTGWQVMFSGYTNANGGVPVAFSCPSERPFMQAVNVDTQIKW